MSVWLLDAYDRPGQSAAPDFLIRLPVGTRVLRPAEEATGDLRAARALVITGSAASAADKDTPWIRQLAARLGEALAADVPVLGVCFGHQLLAEVAGGPGAVRRAERPEVGRVSVGRAGADPVLDVLPTRFDTFASHEDEVRPVPGIEVLAASDACAVQALRVPGRRAWGVQFHLETDPSEAGRILRWRASRGQGIDPEATLATLGDTSGWADALFAAFLAQAGVRFGPAVERVTGQARDALLEHLIRLKHDLGKYVCFQQRWLPADADAQARQTALEADLLHTRRGPNGSVDALRVWADFRPALVGEGPLGGTWLDLRGDPDLARLDGALRALGPVVEALRAGQADPDRVARGMALAARAAEASRSLVERARSGSAR